MVRKKAKRTLGILCASVLAAGLLAATGCDDSSCEGDECTSSPIVTPDNHGDDDDLVVTPSCEKMCAHVFDECSDSGQIANGDPVTDEECFMFCEAISDAERGCLTQAPCTLLPICLGGSSPSDSGRLD